MDEVDVVDVLVSARKLIEEDWWQDGNPAHDGSWCAVIALDEAALRAGALEGAGRIPDSIRRPLEVAMDVPDIDGMVRFNDSHSHEEVLAAFDKAIATELEAGVSA